MENNNNNNNNNRPTIAWSSVASRIKAEVSRLVEKRSELLRNIADMKDERELLYAEQRKVAEHAMDSYDDVELFHVETGTDGKLIVTLKLTVDFGDDEEAIKTYRNAGPIGAVYSADRQIGRLTDEVGGIGMAIEKLENWSIEGIAEQFINTFTPWYARPLNNKENN